MKQITTRLILFLLTLLPCVAMSQDNAGGLVNGFIFDEAENFMDGMARVKLNGKYGFINAQGQLTVPLIYDECGYFSDGFARVKKDGKWGLVNKAGVAVVPVKYDNVGMFHEGLVSVQNDGKWGYVDMNGYEVIPPQYGFETYRDYLDYGRWDWWSYHKFKNGYSVVIRIEDGVRTDGLIDRNGRMVIPFNKFTALSDYSDGMIMACRPMIENGKYVLKFGFINLRGETVIPFKYESAGDFSEGLAMVQQNEKVGYIDKTGRVVIPFRYDSGLDFEHGIAWVESAGDTGYINRYGMEVVPVGKYGCYGAGSLGRDGYIPAQQNGRYGLVDKTGNVLIPFMYEDMNGFTDGVACVKLDGKWGAVDLNGKEVIPIMYEDIGYRALTSGYTMVKLGGKCGYIDRQGKMLEIDLDAESSYKMGMAVERGLHEGLSSSEISKIRSEAFEWFMKGALKGNKNSCYAVGFYYYNGIIVEKNYAEAVKWFAEATDSSGFSGAAYRDLGYCYNSGGFGLAKDDEKAFRYLLEGAALDNRDCIYAVAVCYLQGVGCDIDPRQACVYAEKVYEADSNYSLLYSACYNALAFALAKEKDYESAFNAIDKALGVELDTHTEANIYDSKGEIYLMMGDKDKALEMWRKVMELDKENLEFYKQNSVLYKQLGAAVL